MSEKTKRKESDNLANWYRERMKAWSIRRAMFKLYTVSRMAFLHEEMETV